MNLTGLNENELAQKKADWQNKILESSKEKLKTRQELRRIKIDIHDLEKKKMEMQEILEKRSTLHSDLEIELDMITDAFWASRKAR